jgi:hypothetical protein
MKTQLLLGAAIGIALFATAAAADPAGDLSQGLAAMNRHEPQDAVTLLSGALDSHALSAANQELALVRRAEAYELLGRIDEALADARGALAINPSDPEAKELLAYALHTGVPAPHGRIINRDGALNAEVAARNQAVNAELEASQAQYQAKLASYETEKASSGQAYAADLAAYQANVAAANAAQDAWKAAVAACRAGDRSKCAKP